MNDEKLAHDASVAAAHRITELVAHLLREEEQADMFQESYQIVRASIEAYSVQLHRQQRRAQPSRN